ncbi:major facilitator superfamily domain-containing protein [Xylogone sp. PMI_703]|nr:major facilitator superfamily domain-containing protein [Xylogone sp. PMI_703]
MIPFGAGIVSATAIANDLGDVKNASWIGACYPLTQGAFILIGGRVGAVHGHKKTLLLAGFWWTVFSLASGFAKSLVTLTVLRALTGIGGGFIIPNAIALLTINFPPGKQRNLAVGFFGAMAPIGAAGGSIFGGIFVQLTPWKYLFFFLAIAGAFASSYVALVVSDEPEPLDKDGRIDYIGAYLGVAGLILFNFVWNQAPFVGWNKAYEYSLLVVALIHLAAFVWWEAKCAKEAILPLNILKAPSFGPMLIASFFSFMGVGIFTWYCNVWNLVLRHFSIVLDAAAWIPLMIGGTISALTCAWLIPRLEARYILMIGSSCVVVASTLTATMPDQQTYWAQMFPAICVFSFGPDFIFTAAQIITSNSVKKNQQGIAGSLIGTILFYGQSTGIGFAGTVETYTNKSGRDIGPGYRHALYLSIALAACATMITALFVRIPPDNRAGRTGNQEGITIQAITREGQM